MRFVNIYSAVLLLGCLPLAIATFNSLFEVAERTPQPIDEATLTPPSGDELGAAGASLGTLKTLEQINLVALNLTAKDAAKVAGNKDLRDNLEKYIAAVATVKEVLAALEARDIASMNRLVNSNKLDSLGEPGRKLKTQLARTVASAEGDKLLEQGLAEARKALAGKNYAACLQKCDQLEAVAAGSTQQKQEELAQLRRRATYLSELPAESGARTNAQNMQVLTAFLKKFEQPPPEEAETHKQLLDRLVALRGAAEVDRLMEDKDLPREQWLRVAADVYQKQPSSEVRSQLLKGVRRRLTEWIEKAVPVKSEEKDLVDPTKQIIVLKDKSERAGWFTLHPSKEFWLSYLTREDARTMSSGYQRILVSDVAKDPVPVPEVRRFHEYNDARRVLLNDLETLLRTDMLKSELQKLQKLCEAAEKELRTLPERKLKFEEQIESLSQLLRLLPELEPLLKDSK